MVVKRRSSKKSSEPEFGWQNIAVWEGRNGLSGKVTLTPEFMDDLLNKLEDGDIELLDTGHIELVVVLRESDSDNPKAPVYRGSIFLGDQEEEEAPKRKKKTTRRRVEEEEDEDDEPEVDPRRKSRAKTSRTRTR